MGEKNSEVLKQVLEENLENAITFKKSESGYPQNPIDRNLGLTKSHKMKRVSNVPVHVCNATVRTHSGRTERKPA